jgi:membrane-bound ClpP family serine protease
VDVVVWVMIGAFVYAVIGLVILEHAGGHLFFHDFLGALSLLCILAWPLLLAFQLVFRQPGPSGDQGHAGPEPPDRGYVGAEADVVTDLRPWGTVRVGGQQLDARAETGFVAAGGRVRVVGVERRGLVVRHEPA